MRGRTHLTELVALAPPGGTVGVGVDEPGEDVTLSFERHGCVPRNVLTQVDDDGVLYADDTRADALLVGAVDTCAVETIHGGKASDCYELYFPVAAIQTLWAALARSNT